MQESLLLGGMTEMIRLVSSVYSALHLFVKACCLFIIGTADSIP